MAHLHRFYLVRGVPGCVVPHPYAPSANPPRYLGKVRNPAKAGEVEEVDRLDDVEEVVLVPRPDHLAHEAEVGKTIAILAKCEARDHDEAAAKFAAMKPAAAKNKKAEA